jgi:hypothetical protein
MEPTLHGSFNAWYEQDTQAYPFIYSEITGYLVTLMCYLWERKHDERYLRSATMAGDWLLDTTLEPNGGFRCLYPLRPTGFDFKQSQMYAFDNGMVLNGLVNLYRVSRQEKYLASAVTAADWLVYSAQKPTGAFYPIYQLDEDRFFESDKEWSICSGSYHAKIAIGLLNLYDLTHKRKYLDAAVRVCDFALGCQDETGRFISFLSRGGTNAHPHCYTAEGLWVAGTYLDRGDYLASSAHAVRWLLDRQSPEGYIPRLYLDNQPVYSERVDAICQTLRLAILHTAEARLPETYSGRIELLRSLIPKYQAFDEDSRVDGGFYFGYGSNGHVIPHVNVWVTAFAVQALWIYSDYCTNNLDLNPFLLV